MSARDERFCFPRKSSSRNAFQLPGPRRTAHRCRSRDHRHGCIVPDRPAALWIAGHCPATECSPSRWNGRRIDLLLKRGSPLEVLPGPEFDRRHSKWQPFGCHRQAGVHQDAQTVCDLWLPALSRPLFMLLVIPIVSELSLC